MAADLAALCIRTGRLALLYNGLLIVRRGTLREFTLSTSAPVLIWRRSWKKDDVRISVASPADGLTMIRAALNAEVLAEQQRVRGLLDAAEQPDTGSRCSRARTDRRSSAPACGARHRTPHPARRGRLPRL